jgi:hypothetical protein
MNVRIHDEHTPERRIAAALMTHFVKVQRRYRQTRTGPSEVDIADTAEFISPYLQKELLAARLEECTRSGTFQRALELVNEIDKCTKGIEEHEK